MSTPNLSNADFTAALLALLPRGRVWPRDMDSVQACAVSAFAPTFQRHLAGLAALLVDAFPATSVFLLPEWEATLGLPDPCSGPQPTLALRRAQVMARLFDPGGQSVSYLIAAAAALGYTITIDYPATPFRVGHSRAGDELFGPAWVHAWRVNAPAVTVREFRAGQSAAGEPLRYWTNAILECELRALAPAHTVVQFSYS
jgi:uncharacterized protein YmfQ (DUF2313 family)